MERLQFIVRETNKLLGTNYNLLSFDGLGSTKLLQLVCDVLQALGANTKVRIYINSVIGLISNILARLKIPPMSL